MKFISIKPAHDDKHKYIATFEDGNTYKVSFGAVDYHDYTTYYKQSPEYAKNRKQLYITRHKMREDWANPRKPGFWSRWILWNLPTVRESIEYVKSKWF